MPMPEAIEIVQGILDGAAENYAEYQRNGMDDEETQPAIDAIEQVGKLLEAIRGAL